MAAVRVLVLRAAGTNCDLETQHAWELAGAVVERLHIRRLIEAPARLDRFQILTIPGGFSYGDDIAAGRIFATQLRRHLDESLRRFVDTNRLVLGVCNGFQVLVQLGLLPFCRRGAQRMCTITYNIPAGFQDRWVRLRADTDRCVFLERGRHYELPIAHGEGRVVFSSAADLNAVEAADQKALTYVPGDADTSTRDDQPYNPNGSTADIAGLCDESGRVLGLMPHPERFVDWTQHPAWTVLERRSPGDGLRLFQSAVTYFA